MPLIFGALADDLTGGMELAAMLVAQGVRCGFVTSSRALDAIDYDIDAVVVAHKTRVAPAAEAVVAFEHSARALLDRGARRLFFKYCATFDSTDDGNIGPCADLLLRMTGARFTAFCPSFPEAGRRVFQGHLFADAMLISESPKRFDPLTPMLDPNLVRTLQRQTSTPVGLLPQQVVRQGVLAMQTQIRALQATDVGFAIADAADASDLEALAELTCGWPLMTGNSSICAYYPALWRDSGDLPSDEHLACLPAVDGPGVVLSGSCADRSIEQLRAFELSRPVLWLDLERAIDGADLVTEAIIWARDALRGGPVAIATSAPAAAVERAQSRLGRHEAARLAEDVLSRLAVALRADGVRRFVISGGETSGAVLERLELEQLHVGPYIAPGIAHATTHAEHSLDGLALCLKSGKLGPVDMLLPMLDSMQSQS